MSTLARPHFSEASARETEVDSPARISRNRCPHPFTSRGEQVEDQTELAVLHQLLRKEVDANICDAMFRCVEGCTCTSFDTLVHSMVPASLLIRVIAKEDMCPKHILPHNDLCHTMSRNVA